MKAKLIKIGNVILDILVFVILIISLTVVVLSTTSRKNGVSSIFGYTFLSVQTDSMEPTIKVGDMIIGHLAKENAEYEIGDIVTFKTIEQNQYIFNTHRIVSKDLINGIYHYETKGDNTEGQDDGHITADDVLSKWEGKRIGKLGAFMDFLKTGIGFFIFLMIPVILFFLFYLYKFIKNLLLYNREKTVDEAKKTTSDLDEEQKQKIIAEYLAAQQKEKTDNEESTAESSEDNKA